jgi:hypothetical protein
MAVGSSACDSSELNLVKKKNTKSPVWNFFGLRADDNDRIIEEELDRPVCRECCKVVPAKGGNTSNLFWHLKEHHSALYAEISPISRKGECSRNGKSQQTLENAIARSTKYSRDSPQHKDITRAVAYHIGKDGVSLSTVESAGFKHMINKLNPKYDLPSRKYFSQQAIPALYIEVHDCLLSELKQVSHCAITTDLWTSCSTEPYITVTIHYINSDWELKSACLQTVALLKDHTGQNVADCLMEIFANWEINPNKIVAATTDNGSNVVLAFELLQILRISCFGHNLHLCAKKGLDSTGIQRALSRCHSVVSLFNRSWKKTRDLKEKQQVLDLPQHKLKRDVSTRWGSTYEMLDRIIEQQQAICAVLAEDRKTWNSMPSDEEISVLETVKDVLENVFYLTDALAGEKEVTASSICCILAHLRKKLSANEGDCRVAIGMKERMLTDLNKRNILPETIRTSINRR